jgi:hypothetical protein
MIYPGAYRVPASYVAESGASTAEDNKVRGAPYHNWVEANQLPRTTTTLELLKRQPSFKDSKESSIPGSPMS